MNHLQESVIERRWRRREFCKSIALLSAALPIACATSNSGRAQLHAISIGFTYVQSPLPPLLGPAADVDLLGARFKKMGAELAGSQLDPTNVDLMRLLSEYFERLNQGDVGLVYLSGHGIKVGDNDYIVLSDGLTHFSLQSLVESLRATDAEIVVFFDACRTYPVSSDDPNDVRMRKTRMAGPKGLGRWLDAREGETLVYQASDQLKFFSREVSLSALLDASEGPPHSTVGPGFFVGYAAVGGTASQDSGAADRPSYFAAALDKHLADWALSTQEVMNRVTRDVQEQTGGAQLPGINRASSTNIFPGQVGRTKSIMP